MVAFVLYVVRCPRRLTAQVRPGGVGLSVAEQAAAMEAAGPKEDGSVQIGVRCCSRPRPLLPLLSLLLLSLLCSCPALLLPLLLPCLSAAPAPVPVAVRAFWTLPPALLARYTIA